MSSELAPFGYGGSIYIFFYFIIRYFFLNEINLTHEPTGMPAYNC